MPDAVTQADPAQEPANPLCADDLNAKLAKRLKETEVAKAKAAAEAAANDLQKQDVAAQEAETRQLDQVSSSYYQGYKGLKDDRAALAGTSKVYRERAKDQISDEDLIALRACFKQIIAKDEFKLPEGKTVEKLREEAEAAQAAYEAAKQAVDGSLLKFATLKDYAKVQKALADALRKYTEQMARESKDQKWPAVYILTKLFWHDYQAAGKPNEPGKFLGDLAAAFDDLQTKRADRRTKFGEYRRKRALADGAEKLLQDLRRFRDLDVLAAAANVGSPDADDAAAAQYAAAAAAQEGARPGWAADRGRTGQRPAGGSAEDDDDANE
jgi:hypothetical protein